MNEIAIGGPSQILFSSVAENTIRVVDAEEVSSDWWGQAKAGDFSSPQGAV
jgi:hypothetical protein